MTIKTNILSIMLDYFLCIDLALVCLVWFYGISTIGGYLMPTY